MTAFIDLLFHSYANAVMTIISGLLVIYWMFAFLSGTFLSEWDWSPEVDTDVDMSIEGSQDSLEGADIGGPTMMDQILSFINVGKVPFMLILSILQFISWILTLLTSSFVDMESWGIASLLILIPAFLLSYLLTRLVTNPLTKIYAEMGYKGETQIEIIGMNAIMRSSIEGDKIGAAEITHKTELIRINVKSEMGDKIPFGATVAVTGISTDQKYYMVIISV